MYSQCPVELDTENNVLQEGEEEDQWNCHQFSLVFAEVSGDLVHRALNASSDTCQTDDDCKRLPNVQNKAECSDQQRADAVAEHRDVLEERPHVKHKVTVLFRSVCCSE